MSEDISTATDLDTVEHLISREPEVLSEEPVVFDDGEVTTRSELEGGGTESEDPEVEPKEAKPQDEKSNPETDESVETLRAQLEHERSAKRAARRAERRLKQELAEARKPPTPEGDNKKEGAPVFDDYEDINAFLEDWTKWNEGQAKPDAIPQAPPELIAAIADINDVRAEGESKYPDYALVYDNATQFNDQTIMAIADTSAPEDVAYYLAKNKAELARITVLDERGIVREIAKLEERIQSGKISLIEKEEKKPEEKKPPAKRTTGAPEPIKTIEGGGSDEKSWEDLSQAEYEAKRAKQQRARN